MVTLQASSTPAELLGAQIDSEVLTFPTATHVFTPGESANSIYAVRRGIIELMGEAGDTLCYRPGELFSYQDIVWSERIYRNTAVARTPVELIRLDRLRFLNLLHNHPTLAVHLLAQQHDRLREQRTSGTCCY